MNAVATQPKPPILAGGRVAALVPQSLEEAFRVSQAIAASGLAPKGIDKPEQILVAIMAGAELGLAPFQALQSIAVINGRPSVWGDGLMAIVRSQGFTVKEWIDGDGDAMVARCEVTRPDNADVATGSFSVADAKKANLWGKAGPWQSYPKRMLQMRARSWALRDGAADVLRGFSIREEVEDYQTIRDVTPQATGMRARLEARTPVGGFDPEHVTAEIDEALAGDRLPDFSQREAEAVEVEAEPELPIEDFPGDRPPTESTAREPDAANNGAGTDGLSLAQRVAAFDERLGKAATTTKLASVWAAATQLRNDLERSDPEEGEAMSRRFNDRYAAVEEAERAARQ